MIVRAFMWGGNPVLARLGLFLKSFAKMQLKRSLGREPTDHFPAAQSLQDRGLPFPAFHFVTTETGMAPVTGQDDHFQRRSLAQPVLDGFSLVSLPKDGLDRVSHQLELMGARPVTWSWGFSNFCNQITLSKGGKRRHTLHRYPATEDDTCERGGTSPRPWRLNRQSRRAASRPSQDPSCVS
jgi:hypothetical protein